MWRKAAHGFRKQAKPADAFGFLASVAESLQAKADTQERHAGPDPFHQGLPHAQAVECPQHLPEVANARQKNAVRFPQRFRRGSQFVRHAQFFQCVLHTAEIACSVIEDGDHSRPFVEGS